MRDRLRYALLTTSAISGVGIFVAFTFVPEPGWGIPHFFYVSIILAALAGGPWIGAAAAAIATAMYTSGVVVNPAIPPSEVLTTGTAVRFVTFMTVGLVTGYFATRNRQLLAELELLAERDALTGLPNTRAFERAIGARLGREEPFALLVGGVDSSESLPRGPKDQADDAMREIANRLLGSLLPGDEVARIGDDTFAVLTYAASAADAGKSPLDSRASSPTTVSLSHSDGPLPPRTDPMRSRCIERPTSDSTPAASFTARQTSSRSWSGASRAQAAARGRPAHGVGPASHKITRSGV